MTLSLCSLITSFAVTAAACSPGPAPVSQSPRDPSNPSAAEGAVPPSSKAMLMNAPSVAATHEPTTPEHAGHQHGAAPATSASAVSTDAGSAAVVYVCPMHPEVTSSSPGKCPKCGMTLVPKK